MIIMRLYKKHFDGSYLRLFKGCVCSSKYKSFLICVRDTKLLHCILLLKLFVTLVRCCASVQYLKVGYGHHHPGLVAQRYGHHHPGGTALGEAIELVGEVYVRLLFPDFESQKGLRGR